MKARMGIGFKHGAGLGSYIWDLAYLAYPILPINFANPNPDIARIGFW